jgi:hypothetical protein
MRTYEDERQVNHNVRRQIRENRGFINVRYLYFSEETDLWQVLNIYCGIFRKKEY